MREYPKGSTARVYHDGEGNPIPLPRLVRDEPDWAVNRIRHCEDYEQLQATNQQLLLAAERILKKLESEYEHVNMLDQVELEKAITNAKQREG